MYEYGIHGEKYIFVTISGEDISDWALEHNNIPCSLEIQKNMSYNLIGLTRAAVDNGNHMTTFGMVSVTTLRYNYIKECITLELYRTFVE